MKRITILLSNDLYEHLQREAFSERISMTQLIRARLEQNRIRRGSRRTDPLAAVEGIVRDGSLTEGIDDALYSS